MPRRTATPQQRALSRRGFLRLAGATGALGTLARVPLAPAVARARAEDASGGAPFFDAQETEILTQIMERVVETGLPDAPRVRDTGAVATADAFCRSLAPAVSGQLPLALRLFEYGPLLFELRLARFTTSSAAEQDASLRGWMTSRLALRRMAFLGLRNLCFVGYYSQDETWPLIGYQGPLLARPAAAADAGAAPGRAGR